MNSTAQATQRLVGVLALATAFEAVRAGGGTFRILLDLPARHAIGAEAFAAFSRATDLSRAGVLFYVLYGVGGLLVTAAAFAAAWRARASMAVRRLTGAALVCSLLILALTTQAAPLMWAVGRSQPGDPAVGSLLDRFTLWTDLRVLCADVSFGAILGALTWLAWRGVAP
jgi:hypothetical protein